MAAVIAAAALALQTTLSRPTAADALAVRVVSELQLIASIRSNQTLTSLPIVQARCRAHGKRDIVALSDGSRIAVDRAGVTQTRGQWRSAALVNAEARLAACPRLLVGEITKRLFAGKQVIDGKLSFDGVPAYRIRVDSQPPTVFLIVSRRDLTPLAVRLRGGRELRGQSRVLGIRLAPIGLTGNVIPRSAARESPAP